MSAVRNLLGTVIPKETFPEKATQTFKKGALLKQNGGYVDECGADPTLVTGLATQDGQSGATDGAKSQVIEIAHPGILFVGNLSNAGDTAVTAQTDQGAAYGVAKHSGGKWYVDKDETSNKRVRVWNFWLQDNDALGDTRGRVYFTFDPTYCELIKV